MYIISKTFAFSAQVKCIRVSPHRRYDISFQRPIDCLFKNVSRITTMKASKHYITAPLRCNPPPPRQSVDSLLKVPVMWIVCPYHGSTMSTNILWAIYVLMFMTLSAGEWHLGQLTMGRSITVGPSVMCVLKFKSVKLTGTRSHDNMLRL